MDILRATASRAAGFVSSNPTASMSLFRYAACAAALCALPAQAQTYAEHGDAPAALDGTADATGQAYTAITGALTAAGAAAAAAFQDDDQDIDCYAITVANPAAFSASTENASNDTVLILFDSALNALLFADGIQDRFIPSLLPAGSLTGPAGDYVLCISDFIFNARNSAGTNIFPGSIYGVDTPSAVDTQLASFDTDVLTEFSYQIDLTGLGALTSDLPDVDLTVSGIDVTVPSSGGKATVQLSITNNEDVTVNGSLTASVEGRGELRVNTGRLRPNQTRTYTYRLNFPRRLADGPYLVTLTAEVGGDVVAADSYTVVKGDVPVRLAGLAEIRLQAEAGDKAAQATVREISAEAQTARAARLAGVSLIEAELVPVQARTTSSRKPKSAVK